MGHQTCCRDKAPEMNALLDALGHHLRREIIFYFEQCTTSETATFDELLAHLHDRLPESLHEGLKAMLVHNHLPKLADCGWIEYDPRSEIIRYHGHDSAAVWLQDLHDVFATNTDALGDE